MEAWQQGYDLDYLKSLANIFRERHGKLVFGAFGLVKERDVAAALKDNRVSFIEKDGNRAVAIWRNVKVLSSFIDFTGKPFSIQAGALRVDAFAATSVEVGTLLLRVLISHEQYAGFFGMEAWVEIFEEDEIAKKAVYDLHLNYVATKILAGSEIKGVYCTMNPNPEGLDPVENASLVVLEERISERTREAMLAEAESFGTWAQHYSSYNKRKSWSSFALRGYKPDDPTFIIKPTEMSTSWKEKNNDLLRNKPEWTRAADRCPVTMDCVRSIIGDDTLNQVRFTCLPPMPPDRVRFMRLAPMGELTRHADITDRDAGLADGRVARLHLPLRTSEQVLMHGWDKRGRETVKHFPERWLCYLDQRGPHRVENNDPTLDRIHLVIDVWSNQGLRQLIRNNL